MGITEHDRQNTRYYFVDEAGDPVLFNRRGRVNVGHPGCSRYFMLGVLDIESPDGLTSDLEQLRAELLADPYFRNVPSFQPKQKKTTVACHAKNDLPEVRREVFRLLLRRQGIRFSAVVKSKDATVQYVRSRNRVDPEYRYQQNELYDFLVRRLFKTRLHKADECDVCFARRGTSDRSQALRRALEIAQLRARAQWGIQKESQIKVRAGTLVQCGGLQAVDYFLWALQRLYERREDRYITMLWPLCSVIIDVDDTRKADYGAYYTRKKPLSLAAIENVPGI